MKNDCNIILIKGGAGQNGKSIFIIYSIFIIRY